MRFVSTSFIVLACTFLLPNGLSAREQTVRTVSVVHRAASSIAKDIEAVLDDDAVVMHVEGQRIILRGDPKRVSELVRLIQVLDKKATQFSITVLQSSEPISLDGRQNLLQIKQYSTDNRRDKHTVQHILVQEDKEATLTSDDVSFTVKSTPLSKNRVQLDFIRQFSDENTDAGLTTSIVVPIGQWTQVGGERYSLDSGRVQRQFATEKAETQQSHVYVKVEKVQ